MILGLRVNTWTSVLAIGGVAVFLAVRGLRRRPDNVDAPYDDGHRWTQDSSTAAEAARDLVGTVADS